MDYGLVDFEELVKIVQNYRKVYNSNKVRYPKLNLMRFFNDLPIFIKVSELEMTELGIDDNSDIQLVDKTNYDRVREINVNYSSLGITESGFKWIGYRKYDDSVKTIEIYFSELEELIRG